MGYLYVLGYILLVGIGTFLMKVSLKNLTPYQLNFLIAIGMFFISVPALLLAQRSLKMPVKEVPMGFLIGLMMAGGSVLFTLAVSKMSPSVASVLVGLYVVVVVVLSWLFLKESFDWIKVVGLVFAFAGTAILTFRS